MSDKIKDWPTPEECAPPVDYKPWPLPPSHYTVDNNDRHRRRCEWIDQAAIAIAAATESDGGWLAQHRERAAWAYDAAESLWEEKCRREGGDDD